MTLTAGASATSLLVASASRASASFFERWTKKKPTPSAIAITAVTRKLFFAPVPGGDARQLGDFVGF